MLIDPTPRLSFDDVLLVPRYTDIESRFNGSISLATHLGKWKLDLPIISANMDSVTGPNLLKLIQAMGGTGIIHRFLPVEQHISYLKESKVIHKPSIGCIGAGDQGKYRWEQIREYCDMVLVDVAHGHAKVVGDIIRWLHKQEPTLFIIAGNIATPEGTEYLISQGCQAVKVGVGPGSMCSTRTNTGCGYPQLSAIIECSKITKKYGIHLIADGGIRSGGDVIKAIAGGADSVMIGSLLAGTTEALGPILSRPIGSSISQRYYYKVYKGMSSAEVQQAWKGSAPSVEGEVQEVPFKGSAKKIIEDLKNNMLSGMSYQGAHNLEELRENARFILQTPAGLRESIPHGLL